MSHGLIIFIVTISAMVIAGIFILLVKPKTGYELIGEAVADNMRELLEERDKQSLSYDELKDYERRLNDYEQELIKYHEALDKQASKQSNK